MKHYVVIVFYTAREIWGSGRILGQAPSFIDFTSNPDVAYFFATNCAHADDSHCRVFCGSSAHVNNTLGDIRRILGAQFPRIVRITVDNLWRLEVQEGFFLDLPLPPQIPLESLVLLHAIDFPVDGRCPSPIPRERIYPERKSALELQLDQYFYEEFVQDGLRHAEERGIELHHTAWEENIHAFKSCELPPPHRSWTRRITKQWSVPIVETFADTVGNIKVTIPVPNSQCNSWDARTHFERSIRQHLKDHDLRNSAVTFSLIQNQDDKMTPAMLARPLELFWDGVRRLPYSDSEICKGFGTLATLFWMACSHHGNGMADLLGNVIEIEGFSLDSVHFRAPISESGLENALRSDMRANFDLASFPVLSDPLAVINHLHDVRRLFGFQQFRKLMITELIPGQIVKRFDATRMYDDVEMHTTIPMWIVFNPIRECPTFR